MGDLVSIHDSWRGSGGADVGVRCIYESLLPAMSSSVSRMRWDLDRALAHHGVASTRRADIALVLTEAADNVVVHAYRAGRPGPLYASAQLPGQTLIISVIDYGGGTGSRSQSPGAGLGLSIMDRLADDLLVVSNKPEPGTSVHAVFAGAGCATAVRPCPTDSDKRAEMFREYLRVLCAAHQSLRQDTEAVLAQASQALAYARRCQRDRAVKARTSGVAPRGR